MLTLVLNIGTASKYLLTDLNRMLTTKESPYVVLLSKKLDIKVFAECLSIIYNQGVSFSFVKWGSRKLDNQQLEIFLDDLINERKSSVSIPSFNNSILIVSKGIDHTPLVYMKVLKIRGICDLLAIDISSMVSDESIFRLGNELKNDEFYKNDFYAIYKPSKMLNIVSGVTKTVISTEENTKQILRNYPDIVTKYDKAAIQEPLM